MNDAELLEYARAMEASDLLYTQDRLRWDRWNFDQQLFDTQLDARFPTFLSTQSALLGHSVKHLRKITKQHTWDPDLHAKLADAFRQALYDLSHG